MTNQSNNLNKKSSSNHNSSESNEKSGRNINNISGNNLKIPSVKSVLQRENSNDKIS